MADRLGMAMRVREIVGGMTKGGEERGGES